MYQHLVTNSEGEPMYVEDVMDAMEEHEAYLEEMQKRADDPWYAMMREREAWCEKARAAFESQGLRVPSDMEEILAREMRRAALEAEEKAALAEMQPALDFLDKHFPNTFEGRYSPPNPAEVGYAYIDFRDWSNRPYRDEMEPIIKSALEQDIYIEDYLSMRDFRTRENN